MKAAVGREPCECSQRTQKGFFPDIVTNITAPSTDTVEDALLSQNLNPDFFYKSQLVNLSPLPSSRGTVPHRAADNSRLTQILRMRKRYTTSSLSQSNVGSWTGCRLEQNVDGQMKLTELQPGNGFLLPRSQSQLGRTTVGQFETLEAKAYRAPKPNWTR